MNYSNKGLKLTNEEYDLRLINFNLIRVDDYINSKTAIRHACVHCKKIYKAKPKEILRISCDCILKVTEYKIKIRSKNLELLENYKNIKTKLLHKCLKCNNSFSTTPKTVLQSKMGCPSCAGKKFTEEKTQASKKILNVASVAGFTAGPLMASYFASKAFVVSFSKALACELKPLGVQVSCLCPGPTRSEFAKRAGVNNKLAFNFGMSATAVADISYKKLMQGKTIIITGLQNKLLVMLMKILPYQLLTWINKKILEF